MKWFLLCLFGSLLIAHLPAFAAGGGDEKAKDAADTDAMSESIQNEPGLESGADPNAPMAEDGPAAPDLYPPDPERYEHDKDYRSAVRRQALAPIKDVPGLPRVMIIGDSISIGYTLAVRDRLKGIANVHRPPVNCGGTRFSKPRLDEWLGTGPWDVIVFNMGLHDSAASAKVNTTDERYEKNLREIVAFLKSTNADLIWMTTTPRPPGNKGDEDRVPKLNAIALRVMHDSDIPVLDLNAAVQPRLEKIQRPDDAHYTLEGYEFLGDLVAGRIKQALKHRAEPAKTE